MAVRRVAWTVEMWVESWVGPMAVQRVVKRGAMWVDWKVSARVEQRGLNWAEQMVALKVAG